MENHELPITQYKRRKSALWLERSTWLEDYKDISRILLPRSGRYTTMDRNRAGRRNYDILDGTGTEALDILGAGLMAGMTSPARPWFRLGIPDKELMKYEPVKLWLSACEELMRRIFATSNTYRSLHTLYEELGGFGTAACFIRPDFKDVMRMYPLTVGEYAISTDQRNEVDTLYREVPMTIAQTVQQFGLDACSISIQNQYNRRNLDQWITIMHAIEPRLDGDREYGKRDGKNMPFKSCYFESSGDPTKPLSESGFKTFPMLTPRWAVRGGDIYGHGPGDRAYGELVQLQHEQLRKGTVIDYQTMPPLQLPSSMRGRENDLLPGGTSYVDMANPSSSIKTAFEVKLDLNALLMDIEDVRKRIRTSFYSDLFLMLANDTRSGITATEIAERHEEKLLMLGPVLERLHNEMLSPLIDQTFTQMIESNILPIPPKELEGMDLKVEFVSTLAQAQRAVGLASVDRILMTVGQIAQAKQDPAVWDKLDTDAMVDGYSDMLGVDPSYIVGNDRVAFIRKSRAEAQQAQQAAAQAPEMANTAATLSNIDTSGTNGLTDIMRQFSGYSSTSPA